MAADVKQGKYYSSRFVYNKMYLNSNASINSCSLSNVISGKTSEVLSSFSGTFKSSYESDKNRGPGMHRPRPDTTSMQGHAPLISDAVRNEVKHSRNSQNLNRMWDNKHKPSGNQQYESRPTDPRPSLGLGLGVDLHNSARTTPVWHVGPTSTVEDLAKNSNCTSRICKLTILSLENKIKALERKLGLGLERNPQIQQEFKEVESSQQIIHQAKKSVSVNMNGSQQIQILLLADSHGRGLQTKLNKLFQDNLSCHKEYHIQSFFKPNARFSSVADGIITAIQQAYESNNTFIIMAGTNDIELDPSEILNTVKRILDIKRDTRNKSRLIILEIPVRYDTNNTQERETLNDTIRNTNKQLAELIEKNPNDETILIKLEFLKRQHFTKHGLHMNNKGKWKLAEVIAQTIQNGGDDKISKPSAMKEQTYRPRPIVNMYMEAMRTALANPNKHMAEPTLIHLDSKDKSKKLLVEEKWEFLLPKLLKASVQMDKVTPLYEEENKEYNPLVEDKSLQADPSTKKATTNSEGNKKLTYGQTLNKNKGVNVKRTIEEANVNNFGSNRANGNNCVKVTELQVQTCDTSVVSNSEQSRSNHAGNDSVTTIAESVVNNGNNYVKETKLQVQTCDTSVVSNPEQSKSNHAVNDSVTTIAECVVSNESDSGIVCASVNYTSETLHIKSKGSNDESNDIEIVDNVAYGDCSEVENVNDVGRNRYREININSSAPVNKDNSEHKDNIEIHQADTLQHYSVNNNDNSKVNGTEADYDNGLNICNDTQSKVQIRILPTRKAKVNHSILNKNIKKQKHHFQSPQQKRRKR